MTNQERNGLSILNKNLNPLCYKQNQILNKQDLSWIIFHIWIFTPKILGYGKKVYHFPFLPTLTSKIPHLSCCYLLFKFVFAHLDIILTLHMFLWM